MTPDDLIALNEEIAGMARVGLPLEQGLEAMAREMGRGRLRRITTAVAADLRAGRTLPEALNRQAGRVPPYYAGLVAAGVRTGRLGQILATLTTYARSVGQLRLIIADALFYPAEVLAFAFGLFAFLALVILPQFDHLFRDFGMRLPALTAAVLELGRHPVEDILLPVLAIALWSVALWLGLSFTAWGRFRWAQFLYSIPVLGTLVRAARLAAFSDLLSILVEQEVPLPEAFRLAGASSSDPLMAAASSKIEQDLREGRPLGEALRGRGLVPAWVAWMTALGEQRGSLGQALREVAGMYRRQAEMRAALLRSVLPPFLIISTAGVLVGLFVFVIMLPMFRLLEGLAN